jgi:hypothetical protein
MFAVKYDFVLCIYGQIMLLRRKEHVLLARAREVEVIDLTSS